MTQPTVDALPHALPPEQITQQLGVQPEKGLSEAEVQERLQQFGPNVLTETKGKGLLMGLWEQLTQPLVLILILAAVVSAFLGKADSTIAIMAIVILNAFLGLFQEYRAEQAIAALRRMAAPLVRVRRDGQTRDIEASQLVPGDIVLLEAGNVIPADSRLIESASLQVQEASLTGESVPVEKITAALENPALPLGDRRNMVYMGTSVTHGRGVSVVTATGMQTELGKIAGLIQGVDSEKTPLQRKMDEVGKVLLGVSMLVMLLAVVIGLLRGQSLDDIMIEAVAIAVAVVPEGLPAVVTISLALGAQRMLKQRALIRKLPAVETLGSVTVICSDKTGTLTENRMTVTMIDVAGHSLDLPVVDTHTVIEMGTNGNQKLPENPAQSLLLMAGVLCNDAVWERHDNATTKYTVLGDPTEAALVVAGVRYGMLKPDLEGQFVRVGEVPFSSERKRMTTIHQPPVGDTLVTIPHTHYAFSKGAVDSLLDTCNQVWVDDRIEPLTPEWRERIDAANNLLAQKGLRVLGMAFRPLVLGDAQEKWDVVEQQMIFIGMMGIIDPPRREVKEAVALCKTAGIRPVMITGDHPLTAQAIARELDIIDDGGEVLTGYQLAHMTLEELEASVNRVSVYARVSPEHKLQIVRALQKHGHIVAMTGDGVNDAPALKQASIGVAMGITGTDVSKEASDMVITDDNFATIVSAVKEGRTIYDNVRRFIKYLLASNTGELMVLLLTQMISGMTMPLTTLQILWMNLITDGFPALALGMEQPEKGAMRRPPYAPNESIFGRGLGRHILIVGGLLGGTALGLGYWAWSSDLQATNGNPAWNTMVFFFLTIAQMGHALGLRSHRESLFSLKFFSNKAILAAVALTITVQLGAVYLPFFNDLFETNPLTLEQLLICAVLSTVVFWGVEAEKWLIRRGVLSSS